MGAFLSGLWNKLFGSKEVRILILGLDAAGKTTILYKLHCGEVLTTIPTIGFNVETVQYKNIKFQVWDLGGQDSIIYVVDSADKERLGIAREELHSMMAEEELKNASLLVFANKQDLPDVLSEAEVSEGLGLSSLRNRQWAIFKSSALKGTGLVEGLDWLANAIQSSQN